MSIGCMQRLIIAVRTQAVRRTVAGGAPQTALLLLLPILAGILLVGPAAGSFAGGSWIGHQERLEPAELRPASLPFEASRDPLESRPALTRGSVSMAALESSRRKLRAPQRPAAEPLILTNRILGEGHSRSRARPSPRPQPALKRAEPGRPFPARGPPLWDAA